MADLSFGTAQWYGFCSHEFFSKVNARKAIECDSRSIDFNPKSVTSFQKRSMCFASLQQFPHALIDANKAIELAPNDPFSHDAKGVALAGLGEFEAALLYLRKAMGEHKNIGA